METVEDTVQDSVLFENTTIDDIAGDIQQAIDSAAIRFKQIHIGSGDEPTSRTRYQEPSAAQLATVLLTPLETSGIVNNFYKGFEPFFRSHQKSEPRK